MMSSVSNTTQRKIESLLVLAKLVALVISLPDTVIKGRQLGEPRVVPTVITSTKTLKVARISTNTTLTSTVRSSKTPPKTIKEQNLILAVIFMALNQPIKTNNPNKVTRQMTPTSNSSTVKKSKSIPIPPIAKSKGKELMQEVSTMTAVRAALLKSNLIRISTDTGINNTKRNIRTGKTPLTGENSKITDTKLRLKPNARLRKKQNTARTRREKNPYSMKRTEVLIRRIYLLAGPLGVKVSQERFSKFKTSISLEERSRKTQTSRIAKNSSTKKRTSR
jgi:nucleoid DNA-binding protein